MIFWLGLRVSTKATEIEIRPESIGVQDGYTYVESEWVVIVDYVAGQCYEYNRETGQRRALVEH